MPINRIPRGYVQEPSAPGRVADSKIYIGIVRANQDVQRMGRLQVWIPEIGGDADTPEHWYTVAYASPFAGATNYASTELDASEKTPNRKPNPNGLLEQAGTPGQQSYGFWFVPPDINNQVLVAFINGEPTRGVWFACLWDQYMNHMVPGIASNVAFDASPKSGDKGAACGNFPPVVEYNKADPQLQPPDPPRAIFAPLANGLKKQGLMSDDARGPSSSGARREAPSKVFGIKTPRGQHFVMDDNEKSEFIRLRTRSGTQVLVNETTGFVYINSKGGNSWIEISDIGIDLYSAGNISLRSAKDINLRADEHVNIDAGRSVNIRATTDDVGIQAGKKLQMAAADSIAMQAVRNDITQNSVNGRNIRTARRILDNSTPVAPEVAVKLPKAQPDVKVGDNPCGTPTTLDTIVSRMPAHEPWSGHPNEDTETPPSNIAPIPLSPSDRGSNVIKERGEGTVTDPNARKKKVTGSGAETVVPGDREGLPSVDVSGYKVPADVAACIKEAADMAGVDYGYMMAMAQAESNFDPHAKAKTSSAKGLYQFIDGTWDGMVKKYGTQLKVGPNDQYDPCANAKMGAMFAKENQAYLKKSLGREPTPTDLYMAHFLGPGGAEKFLKADRTANAASILPNAARANQNIFYDTRNGNQPRSVDSVYRVMQGKIEPKAVAFNKAASSTATA